MRFVHVSLFALLLCTAGCGKKEDDTKAAPAPSAESKKAEAPSSTFAKKPLAANTKAEETTKMKMSLTLDVDPTGSGKTTSSTMDTKESETKEEEILTVSGDAITKVKVKYTDLDSSMNDGKKDSKKPDPRSGKTYYVEYKDGKVVVSNEDGKPTVPAEASLVEKDYHTLGKPDPVSNAIPNRTLKAGEDVPEVAKAIKEVLAGGGGKDMDVSDVSAKFREKSGDDGIFDVTVTLGKTEGPMKMSIPLKGEMRVRLADSQLSGLKLSGPVNVSSADDPKSKMKMSGKGNMELEATRKLKS